MTDLSEFESILDVYSLEEIFEINDVSPEEMLEVLVEEGYLKLPRVKPLTVLEAWDEESILVTDENGF